MRINVPMERWFEWGDDVTEIGGLLAHELTSVGDALMQHQFLFTSGSGVTIVFAEMNWAARRASKAHSGR